MSSVPELYATFLFDQYGYRATWPLGLRLALGDVGFLENGVFDRYTNLHALGVTCETQKSSAARERATHVSSDAVEVRIKVAGEPAPGYSALLQGHVGLLIRFQEQSGFIVSFHGMSHWSIVDHRALQQQILDLYRQGTWERRWFVVTQLIAARSATVLISEATGGEVELSAKASIAPDLGGLGDAEAGLAIVRSQGLSTALLSEGSLTPMFRARHLRRRLFQPPVFEVRVESEGADDATEPLAASELELAESDP